MLRHVDIRNSAEPVISIDPSVIEVDIQGLNIPAVEIPRSYVALLDAENQLVALVPDLEYKDWSHPKTIVELLNWAVANYPAINGDPE